MAMADAGHWRCLLYTSGEAQFAPEVEGHVGDKEVLDAGDGLEGVGEVVELREEGVAGLTGEEDCVGQLGAVFVVGHPGDILEWGLAKLGWGGRRGMRCV